MEETKQPTIAAKEWKDLFLFSTFVFTLSALFVQCAITGITSLLLRHFSISFVYRLLQISYSSEGHGTWNEGRVLFVYSIPLIIALAAGYILLQLHPREWKIRLILTWLSFVLISCLPCGFFAGIFVYQSFGIAERWMFPNLLIRGAFGIAMMGAFLLSRPFWIRRFFESIYSLSFVSEPGLLDQYFRNVMIRPWLVGSVVLSVFAVSNGNWFWFMMVIGMGLVLLPLFFRRIFLPEIFIYKSDKKIFSFKNPLRFIVLALTLLYFLSLIKVSL